MQNLEITCYLKSPIIDDPPFFDGLLGWVIGIELGSFFNKSDELSKEKELPIPLEKEYFGDNWFYKCSNPIYKIEHEWVEHRSKRTDIDKIINFSEKHSKSISVAKGKYKNYYVPMRCKQVDKIKYFARGDKLEVERILNKIKAIGNKRSIGYGFIHFWEVKDIENDYSVCYDLGEQGRMLMKTIPAEYIKNIDALALQNMRREYGRYKLPYWHPIKDEVIVPC